MPFLNQDRESEITNYFIPISEAVNSGTFSYRATQVNE